MEKSSIIKDNKSLIQLYKQINKFRKSFSLNDFSYINDAFLGNSLSFPQLPQLETQIKDTLNFQFNLNTKFVLRLNTEIPEVYFFNALLLTLSLIDSKNHQAAFGNLTLINP